MSKSTTKDVVRVCTDAAKLDRKGKTTVLEYLQEELAKAPVVRKGSANEKEGV